VRWFVIGAVVLFSACGPPFDAPDDDTCSSPVAASLTSLQIGGANEDTFEPLTEGAVVELAQGGQGSDMLGVRFRLEGADLPDCVSHSTIVTTPDEVFDLADYSSPLRTYPAGDGAAETKTLWLVLAGRTPMSGATLFVDSTVSGTDLNLSVWVDAMGADAMPPPGMFGEACTCTGLGNDLCQENCEQDLWCVTDVCTQECFGESDTSCPEGTACIPTNEGGEFLGFFCFAP
jgi:hypothetical protein